MLVGAVSFQLFFCLVLLGYSCISVGGFAGALYPCARSIVLAMLIGGFLEFSFEYCAIRSNLLSSQLPLPLYICQFLSILCLSSVSLLTVGKTYSWQNVPTWFGLECTS